MGICWLWCVVLNFVCWFRVIQIVVFAFDEETVTMVFFQGTKLFPVKQDAFFYLHFRFGLFDKRFSRISVRILTNFRVGCWMLMDCYMYQLAWNIYERCNKNQSTMCRGLKKCHGVENLSNNSLYLQQNYDIHRSKWCSGLQLDKNSPVSRIDWNPF